MRKNILFKSTGFLFLFILTAVSAHSFEIGRYTITYQDPDRNNRSIPTEIYYPAQTAGTQTPFANGTFPVVVFGHGFAMEWSAYQNIWEFLVSQGYIVAFPKTENTLFPPPSHGDFGADINFLVGQIIQSGNTPGSFFYGKTNNKAAVLGHSMGGGAAFLAADGGHSAIKTKITLAAAETNPSAIGAAENIDIPSLVIAGANDCVTPPGDHQILMYNELSTACKFYVSIEGASHCQFANSNFNCSFGESTCSPSASISRAVQQSRTNDLILPWLNYFLKGQCTAWETFNDYIENQSFIDFNASCLLNPATAEIEITGDSDFCEGESAILSTASDDSYTYSWNNGSSDSIIIVNQSGTYSVIVTDPAGCSDTSEVQINVLPSPSPSINAIPGNAVCSVDSIILSTQNVYNSYLWSTGSTEANTIIYDNDTISVIVTYQNGCSGTNEIVLEFFEQPDSGFLYFENDTLFSSINGTFYNWMLDGEILPANPQQNFILPESEGVYMLEIVQSENCSIYTEPFLFTFNHNRNLENNIDFTAYVQNNLLKVNINTVESKKLVFELFDIQGRIIHQNHREIYKNSHFTLTETGNLSSGLYLLRVSKGAQRQVQKIYINH
ncbi:MAG: T9SS C-terminal target domain-containing protein [Chitinophagaceae bacterium]|nr:MAG: T9SS C-terminal target domain-containing protein [Chitinophagaceae bacterium]